MPLDPQAKAFLDVIGVSKLVPIETLTAGEARRQFAKYAEARRMAAVEPVDAVRDIAIDGPRGPIPIRVYEPRHFTPAPALIYFHGGGWVLGGLDSHDHVCRALANKVPSSVLSVDYRLAPEHKFPAAVDDSFAATTWIADHAAELGIDPARIAVGGDSAGGNLATVVARLAQEHGGPRLAFQLLVYPGTDMRMQAPSIDENAGDPVLSKAAVRWFVDHYLNGEADLTNPLASPLLAAGLSGLPPAFIITAECDPLRDEGEAYADLLKNEGVAVEVQRYPGMPHGFFSMAAGIDTARRAVADATARLQSAFAQSAQF